MPMPGVPIPLPPAAVPGTAENKVLAEATIRAIQAASEAVGNVYGRCAQALGRAWDRMFSENGDGQDSQGTATPEPAVNGQRPTKTPNTGTPGSTVVNPGSGQERTYGPDGKPLVDTDWDHDHGHGVPHRHDWVDGVRGPGVPIDAPKPKR
jgi:hypothetical protein